MRGVPADGGAPTLRRIAVVDRGRNRQPPREPGWRTFFLLGELRGGAQRLQPCELILRESLGRKEVQGAGVRVIEEGGEDGQIVGKGLAASGTGGKHEVAAEARVLPRFHLMAVERANAAFGQRRAQRGRQVFGERPHLRGPGRARAPDREVRGRIRIGAPELDEGGEGHSVAG